MSRLKLLPWALGVALLAVTLVGANRLLHPDPTSPGGGGGGDNGKRARPAGSAADAPVIVHGTVTADREPIPHGLSAFLPAGAVAEVFVRDGQEVKAGDPLYRFDDRLAQADVKKAEAAALAAARQHQAALAEQKTHALRIERARSAAASAEKLLEAARRGVEVANATFEDEKRPFLRDENNRPLPAADIERRRRNFPAIVEAEAAVVKAEAELRDKKHLQELAEKEPVAEKVEQAAAAVGVAQAELEKAKLAAAEAVVRAKVAGVVEQLAATPGMVVGPQSRTPLLMLIPAGRRVVRAEVSPEFASRIENKLGRKATVTDDTNAHLTYDGEVRRVGSAFLPKRFGGLDVTGKPVFVLEVEVEVKDPAPPGKPPLRVGQPVRVSIGQ